MRVVTCGAAVLAVIFAAFGSADAANDAKTLVGTHIVTVPREVRFVDREGHPQGAARGGTVLDVLQADGDMLRVDRGWIKRSDVVPQDEAIDFFGRLIEKEPTTVALASRARVWNYLGEFDKAIDDCDEALRLDPQCAMAFDRRAQALTGKGKLDEALADFEKAIKLTPQYASTYSHRARAWLRKGDLDRTLADCDEALKREPSLSVAHYFRGRVWSRKAAPEKAIASYTKALTLNPHYVPALNARGNELYKKGEFAKAEADYNAAILLDPKFDIVHIHCNRGNARLRLNRIDLAKADYERALRYDAKHIPAMQGLAACFAVQQNYKSAVQWQQKAVQLAKADQRKKLEAVLATYQSARK